MIKRVITIIRKEFLHLFRDPRSLALMAFMPIFLLFIYGYAASLDVKNVPLAVLDQDRTVESRNFIEKFTISGYFKLQENLAAESQFAEAMDSDRIKIIINLPGGFGKKVQTGQKAEVQILIDGSDPTWASSVIGYISGIVQTYQQNLVQAKFIKLGVSAGLKLPIDLVTRIWYNETLSSMNFFVPGLICVILMQISATLTCLTIVSEKEQGTMEALVVSPIRKNELMLGKIIPYVIISFLDVLVVTALGIFWFGVSFNGSFLLLVVSSLIFLTGAMAIGVLVSTNAGSSAEAMQSATVVTMLPALLLSGFIFPLENMPWFLQAISYIIPARYYMDILRGVFLKGIGLVYLWPQFLLMFLISLWYIVSSVRQFKKRIE
ncbi:MAG: ABC transporter permease [Candidatus Saganbacteria bacterium]|nr:ABC transporter permease [Candidatus Saganbacteria bacterium]